MYISMSIFLTILIGVYFTTRLTSAFSDFQIQVYKGTPVVVIIRQQRYASGESKALGRTKEREDGARRLSG